jgi:hypothetical protein
MVSNRKVPRPPVNWPNSGLSTGPWRRRCRTGCRRPRHSPPTDPPAPTDRPEPEEAAAFRDGERARITEEARRCQVEERICQRRVEWLSEGFLPELTNLATLDGWGVATRFTASASPPVSLDHLAIRYATGSDPTKQAGPEA